MCGLDNLSNLENDGDPTDCWAFTFQNPCQTFGLTDKQSQ